MEIANRSLFPFPCLSLSALSRRRCRAPPARRSGSPPANSNFASASRWRPRVARKLLATLFLRAGAFSALPRRPEPPRGCHLAAAVTRPGQSPPLFSLARTRTRGLSLIFSPHSLALSLPRRPRTPPPLHPESQRAHPPLRSRHCRPNPPALTPPLAAPRPRAAPQPFSLAQTPPEPPRRRAPGSNSRRSPWTAFL